MATSATLVKATFRNALSYVKLNERQVWWNGVPLVIIVDFISEEVWLILRITGFERNYRARNTLLSMHSLSYISTGQCVDIARIVQALF